MSGLVFVCSLRREKTVSRSLCLRRSKEVAPLSRNHPERDVCLIYIRSFSYERKRKVLSYLTCVFCYVLIAALVITCLYVQVVVGCGRWTRDVDESGELDFERHDCNSA